MSDRQVGQRRSAERRPDQHTGSGSGPDEDWRKLITWGMGVGVLAVVGFGLWRWAAPRLELDPGDPAGAASDAATAAGSGVTGWLSANRAWLITAGVFLVGMLALRWWRRRRARRREEVRQMLAAAVARVMPSGWSSDAVVVTRWRGMQIRRGRVGLSAECPDQDEAWRQRLGEAITERLDVERVELSWPRQPRNRWQKPKRIVTFSVSSEIGRAHV